MNGNNELCHKRKHARRPEEYLEVITDECRSKIFFGFRVTAEKLLNGIVEK